MASMRWPVILTTLGWSNLVSPLVPPNAKVPRRQVRRSAEPGAEPGEDPGPWGPDFLDMIKPTTRLEEFPERTNKTQFDWDAHIAEMNQDVWGHQRDAREGIEASFNEGGNEWFPKNDEEMQVMDASGIQGPMLQVDDSVPDYHWDEVDPAEYNYRNPPEPVGLTWSRIHIKSSWHQWDWKKKKLKDSFLRFDTQEFYVPDSFFDAETSLRFNHIDPFVVAKLMPALDILAGTVKVMACSNETLKLKYMTDAKNRVGVEALARGVIEKLLPDLSIEFTSYKTVDHMDGAALWATSWAGTKTDLF